MTTHSPYRRLLLLALIALTAFGIAACGGSSDEPAVETTGVAVEAGAADAALPSTMAPDQAWALVEDGSATMIDVREPEELAEQRVSGTIDIPLGELEGRVAEVPTGKPVLVLCRSGNRAQPAAAILRAAGYEAVVVDGGIVAWAQAGLPYTGVSPG